MKTLQPLVVYSLALIGALVAEKAAFAQTGLPSITKTVAYTYNANGLIETETIEPDDTSVLKVATTYEYDIRGNVILQSVKGRSGDSLPEETRVSEFRYGSTFEGQNYGEEVKYKRFVTATKNAVGHIANVTDIDARWGAPRRSLDINGNASFAQYDDYGRVVISQASDCVTKHTTYGIPTATWGSSFVSVEVSGALNSASCVGSRSNLLPESARTTKQWQSRTYLNADTQPLRVETQIGSSVSEIRTQYDYLGRKVRTSLPEWSGNGGVTLWSTIEYDLMGRPWKVTAPNGLEVKTDYLGNVVKSTDVAGNATTKYNDLIGRTVQVVDAKGYNLFTQYDPLGNVTRTYDHYGSMTETQYDVRGQKRVTLDPNSGTWESKYNAFGEIVKSVSPRGITSTFGYDSIGRLKNKSVPNGGAGIPSGLDANYFYDNAAPGCIKGSLCKATSTGYSRINGYDVLGRLSEVAIQYENKPTANFSYEYDNWGRVSVQSYPTTGTARLKVKNEYRASDLALQSVKVGVGTDYASYRTAWELVSQLPSGKVERENIGGQPVTNSYDTPTQLLTRVEAGVAGTLFVNRYVYDSRGNLKEKHDETTSQSAISEIFTHDELNRIKTHERSNQMYSTVKYLANGNIHFKGDTGWFDYGNTGSSLPSKPQQLKRIFGYGAERLFPTYDASGNQIEQKNTSGSPVRTNVFNNFDKLMTSEANGNKISLWYGPEAQRVQQEETVGGVKKTTYYFHGSEVRSLGYEREASSAGGPELHRYFVNVGGMTVAQIEANSNTVPGDVSTLEAQKKYRYFLKDHLGTVSASFYVGYSGSVVQQPMVERTFFDPWGQPITAAGARLPEFTPLSSAAKRGFTGHEHIASVGLINMNGRVYDPIQTRFLSVDPFVANAADLQAHNRYSYVSNRPLTHTDPTGYLSVKGGSKFLGGLAPGLVELVLPGSGPAILGQATQTGIASQISGSSETLGRLVDPIGGYARAYNDMPLWYYLVSTDKNMHGQYSLGVQAHYKLGDLAFQDPETYQLLQTIVVGVCGLTTAGLAAPGCASVATDFAVSMTTSDVRAGQVAGFKIGARTAVTSLLFYGAGQYAQSFNTGGGSIAIGDAAWYAKIASHAVVGCVVARYSNGSCAQGAMSSGFSAAATPVVTGNITNEAGQLTAMMLIGGTASVIGGGKFIDGAQSAMLGYLYNHWSHNLELAVYGREAHSLLQNHMSELGYETERSCTSNGNCVDGRFDIANSATREVWEIKRDSIAGRKAGEISLNAYTTPETGLRRGGSLYGLDVGASRSILHGDIEYRYTNQGDGLITYQRYDNSSSRTAGVRTPAVVPLPGLRGPRVR